MIKNKDMELLKNTKTEDFHEIEVEYNYWLFKQKVKYRIIDGCTYVYKHPNKYFETGITEHIAVRKLFQAKVEPLT